MIFLTRNQMGGALIYVLNLSRFLTEMRIDHQVYLYNEYNILNDEVTIDKQITYFRFSKYKSRISHFKVLFKNISPFHFLICNDTFEIEAINYLELPNKKIYILHGDIIHYQHYLKRYHNLFDDVFCVSIGLKRKYKLLYPQYSFKVINPLVSDYTPSSQFPATNNNILKIIFVGRFEILKGGDTILATIDYCQKKEIELQWLLLLPSENNDEVLMRNIPPLVTVVKGLNNIDVLKYFETSDILFFPSRSEGLPMVVLEAMKRGVAPIARNIDIGIPDLIADKENGLLCKTDEEFFEALINLNADRDFLNKIKSNTANFANTAFAFRLKGKSFLDNIDKVEKRNNKSFSKIRYPKEVQNEYLYKYFNFCYLNIKSLIRRYLK